MNRQHNDQTKTITVSDLAALGTGHIAYVRPMTSTQVKQLLPQVTGLPNDVDLFALLGADGTPIMIADSYQELAANAWQNKLVTLSVH